MDQIPLQILEVGDLGAEEKKTSGTKDEQKTKRKVEALILKYY